MTLSVFVFDIAQVQDILVEIFHKVFEVVASVFLVREEQESKINEEKTVNNNSPPFVETLGIAITEQIETKETLG